MERKLENIYLTYNNFLIEQDLWQTHYEILLIIFLKESKKLNVNTDTITKHVKLAKLNISIVTVFLKTKTLKIIQ